MATPAPGRPLRILIDGEPGSAVPVGDRGLNYGDGLFETLAVRDARPCQWRRHMGRLADGCRRLGIDPPNWDRLAGEALDQTAGCARGVLKVLVTRGDAGRGYRPEPGAPSRRIVALYPAPAYPPEWSARGIAARGCKTPATVSPALAGIKHLNRLDSVLARTEWSDPEVAEGILFTAEGEVVGGTMTNLFLWDGRRLLTPPVDRFGVAGTVRALVLDAAARLGIDCAEASLDHADLGAAVGLVLTSSLAGVWPLRRLDDRELDPRLLPQELLDGVRRDALTADGGLA